MFEIELKAHVADRESIIKKLNSFADFAGKFERHDKYWRKPMPDNPAQLISARIRKEISNGKETMFLTYKKKNIVTGKNGNSSEKNQEYESIINDSTAIDALLSDLGFTITDKKDKYVSRWEVSTKFGKATLELCNIPPLGDFLEIEILSSSDDKNQTEIIQNELYTLLEKSGIDKNQIENRFYSQMLRERNICSTE